MKLEQFSVVLVPFPFSDKKKEKKRPALIISSPTHFDHRIGHSVLAMITSAQNTRWPLDVSIQDLKSSGLPAPSIIRMKLFTLDHHFILKRLGRLAKSDQEELQSSLQRLFAPLFKESANHS